MYNFFLFFDKAIEKFSIYTLVLAITAMLALTLTSIIFRFINVTSLWIDPLIRHLVFLSAFLGGVLATGKRQHIGINILDKYLIQANKQGAHKFLERLIHLVSLGTLIWLIIASMPFVEDSFLHEGIVFLGIHRGFLVAIMPFGLSLMAYRFFVVFLQSFRDGK